MNLTTAQNTFAARLYEWSQRDFFREMQEGCPLMSVLGLNNRTVAAFVAWNESLSSSERKAIAIALTRRCHKNAVELKGERITDRDKDWYRAVYEQITIHDGQLPPLASALKSRPNFRPVNPDHCLRVLANSLSPTMGKPSIRKSKVLCTRMIGDWKLVTEFTFLRRESDLSFVYQFIRRDGGRVKNPHPAQGPFPRTMLLFYGVANSSVLVPSQDDSEPMAKAIARLAEYFVAQADPFFAGLGVAD